MTGFRKMLAAALFATFLAVGFGGSASAGDCYKPPCYYKTVVKYVSKTVPYQRKVVAYKPCGTPYYTWKTYYKTVRVPVTYQVKVCP